MDFPFRPPVNRIAWGKLWEQLPPGKRREMLPRWASKLAPAGMNPNEFLAADGLVVTPSRTAQGIVQGGGKK
jgi:hypothetical protein